MRKKEMREREIGGRGEKKSCTSKEGKKIDVEKKVESNR